MRAAGLAHQLDVPWRGAASLLSSLVLLMNGLDVNADWNLRYGDSALFAVTRKLRTAIQREDVELTAEDMDAYLSVNRAFALHSPIVHNLVVVHLSLIHI